MNHSVYSADRATHLKIVISVLAIGIAILGAALTARLLRPDLSIEKPKSLTIYRPQPNRVLVEMARYDGREL